MSRLTKREKVVFYGTVIVVSMLLLDKLMLTPILDKIDYYDYEIAETNEDVEKAHNLTIKKNTVAIVSDGTTIRAYSNGVEIWATLQTLNGLSDNDSFRIGNRRENDIPFDGLIDEVAFWDYGLGPQQIAMIWNGGAGRQLQDKTAQSPSISGSTIINFVPDQGKTLYTVTLDVGVAGVDIAEGDVGLIIPDLV